MGLMDEIRKLTHPYSDQEDDYDDYDDDEMMDDASDEQRDKVREHFYEITKILKDWENEG